MGAFAALPVAALITSIVKNTGKSYDVVYQSEYDSGGALPTARGTGGDAATSDA
jgi:hypothetical protein